MPGHAWSVLYSIREKLAFPKLARQTQVSIFQDVEATDSSSEFDHLSLGQFTEGGAFSDSLVAAWRKYGSQGKALCGYERIYGPILEYLHDKRDVWILELGIYMGGSHRTWRDLVPESTVCGIDNDPGTLIEEDRIQSVWGDQIRVEALTAAANALHGDEEWDLVVDDGWHQPEAGLKSMQVFLPLLKPGGFYVMEDVDRRLYGELWHSFLLGLPKSFSICVVNSDHVAELGNYDYEVVVIRRVA